METKDVDNLDAGRLADVELAALRSALEICQRIEKAAGATILGSPDKNEIQLAGYEWFDSHEAACHLDALLKTISANVPPS